MSARPPLFPPGAPLVAADDQDGWPWPVPDLLHSQFEPPDIRARLQTILALYAHTRGPDQRRQILKRLEEMTLQVAHLMALDLIEHGWRPDEPASQ